MPKVARSKKRKTQYEEFIAQFKDNAENKNLREAGEKLGKLWDDVKKYMDPENPVEIDRNRLHGFLQRYVNIADSLATNIPDKDKEVVFKLRKIMAKDIRIINAALNQRGKDKFNLQTIFDNSRSIVVKVDPKEIEKTAGNTNIRMHIHATALQADGEQTVKDGFFTIHNEPYSFANEKDKIATSIAGDDKDLKEFVSFLIGTDRTNRKKYYSDFTSILISDFNIRRQFDTGLDIDSNLIKSLYSSDEDARRTYANAIRTTLQKYYLYKNITGNDPRYEKLASFVGKLSEDKELDKLMDAGGKVIAEVNRESIISGNDINKKARIDKRNSAFSMVAEMLSLGGLVAHSENMRVQVGDQEYKGTFMNKAEGLDPRKMKDMQELKGLNPDSLTASPEFLRDLANLQLLDYICGNSDRHFNNIFYKMEKKDGKNILTGVMGIDNDTSFGSRDYNSTKNFMHFVSLNDIHIIPRKTAEQILALKPEMLRTMLAGYDLNDKEIEGAVERLAEVKTAINNAWATKAFTEKGQIKKSSSNNFLNIVDEEDIKDISIAKHLYNDKGMFKAGANKKEKENINLYTRLEVVVTFGSVYSNMGDEYYDQMVKQCEAVRGKERETLDSLNYLDKPDKNFYRKSVEYTEMMEAVRKLKENMNLTKIGVNPKNLNIINNAFEQIRPIASDAVFYATSYHTLLQEKIEKKRREGKEVTEAEEKHLNTVRNIVDNLEELYGEYNEYRVIGDKYDKVLAEKKKHVDKCIKKHNELVNAPEKPEVADSFEKIDRMLETDKFICQQNMDEIRRGAKVPSYLGRAVMTNMIEIQNRENYLKLIKGDVPEQERKSLIEDIALNHVLRRVFVGSENVSLECIKTPGLLKEFCSKIKEMRKSEPDWQDSIKHIETNVELLKDPKTPENIKKFNMIMKNGIGSSKDENNFIDKFGHLDDNKLKKLYDEAKRNMGKGALPQEAPKI